MVSLQGYGVRATHGHVCLDPRELESGNCSLRLDHFTNEDSWNKKLLPLYAGLSRIILRNEMEEISQQLGWALSPLGVYFGGPAPGTPCERSGSAQVDAAVDSTYVEPGNIDSH